MGGREGNPNPAFQAFVTGIYAPSAEGGTAFFSPRLPPLFSFAYILVFLKCWKDNMGRKQIAAKELRIRLSLEDYKYDSMSIENQHLALNEFVSSMPESAHAEILEFIDNGYSGTNFERPKVQELIEMVRANKIDCIIVKDYCAIIGLNQKDLENQGILA